MLSSFWYIACPSLLLGRTPRSARVLDAQLVVFRDSALTPHALLDRCCHRGTPLSMGRVVEDTVACAYHGWRFDGSGECVHIPSLCSDQRIPRGCRVPSFPCVERDGYVWVWMSAAGQTPTRWPGMPGFHELGWLQGSRERQCSALRALENSIDWCHPAFVHPTSHPQGERVQRHGFSESAYEIRIHEEGMLVFAPPTPSARDSIPDDAQVIVRFDLPDRITVRRPHQGLVLIMHFVPTSAASCRMEWLLHHAGLDSAGITWTDEEGEIFEQDRAILEACQWNCDQAPATFERSVRADAAPLMLRRIVELAQAGRWHTARAGLRARRVVRLRA